MKAGVKASSKSAEREARIKKDIEWQEIVDSWKQLTMKKTVKFLLGVFILFSVCYTVHSITTSIANVIYKSAPFTIECFAITFLVATSILFLLHYTVLWSRATLYEEIATAFVDFFYPGPRIADVQFLYRMWIWNELALVVMVTRWCVVTLIFGPEMAAVLDPKPRNFSNTTEQELWELHNGLLDSFLGIKFIMLVFISVIFGENAESEKKKRDEQPDNDTQSSQPDAPAGKQQKNWPIALLCGLPHLIGCSMMWYARRKWTTNLDRLLNILWFYWFIIFLTPFPVLSGWVTKEFIAHFYFSRFFVFTIPAFVIFAVLDLLLDVPLTALRRCWDKQTSLPEKNDQSAQRLVDSSSIV